MEINQMPQLGGAGGLLTHPLPPLQWYFVNAEGQQRGPVISRMIMHKWHLGEIDGLTLVYSSVIGEWKKISEVDILKEAISKMAKEEQIAEKEAKRLADQQDKSQQVYYFDEDNGMQAIPMSSTREGLNSAASSGSAAAAVKKSFTADNGLKYQWDDAENDWVEFDGPDSDVEEEKTNSKKWKSKKNTEIINPKRKRDEDGEDAEEEEDDDDDGIVAESTGKDGDGVVQKTKRKKKQKKAKGPNNWIYVSGLPVDVTLEEIKDHFSKMGLIAISAVNQQPKIKIYEDASGDRKGDCALCYNAAGSVTMALEILHEGYIRPGYKIAVKRAEFQASSEKTDAADDVMQPPTTGQFKQSRPKLSQAQVKVAMSAMKQALTWNEDDDMGLSKSKALKIVVMEGMFEPSDFSDASFSDELEGDIATECGKCGQIEKITVFSKNPLGVVIVKFSTSYASQACVKLMDGRFFGGKKLRCYFWDGATDYTVLHTADEAKEEEMKEVKRLDEFGDWLDQDQEDLPDEFRLNVER